MRSLYNILFILFFTLSAPYYFTRMRRRGNWRGGFAERFAKYDASLKQALTNRHVLWLHAVSVGEVNLCTQIIRALEPRVPNLKFLVSTTTTTGMGELRRRLPNYVSKIYYPVDHRKFVHRALGTISPRAIVLVEAEIWPNFLWRAQRLNIPVLLANARLSDRSYPRYRKLGFLFRPLFRSLAGVGAQNEADAARLRAVGCRPEAVRVVGNLKFDTARPEEKRSLDVAGLLRQLGVPPEAPVLVAGSTHDGEELLLAEMARRLRAQFPNLVLILVPRHFERCPEIAKKLKAHGLPFFGRSEITATTQLRPGELECLLVNTTGEQRFFYEQATVVFVGKSLTASGGQNPIEPAALGKATVLGPHMENFRDVTRALLAHDAALQVDDAEGLEMAVAGLLSDKPRRAELGRNALQVVAENRGALDRTTDMILEHLRARGVYETPENGPS